MNILESLNRGLETKYCILLEDNQESDSGSVEEPISSQPILYKDADKVYEDSRCEIWVPRKAGEINHDLIEGTRR